MNAQKLELQDQLEVAIYELSCLERIVSIPERGYTRNCYNRLVRTIQDAARLAGGMEEG